MAFQRCGAFFLPMNIQDILSLPAGTPLFYNEGEGELSCYAIYLGWEEWEAGYHVGGTSIMRTIVNVLIGTSIESFYVEDFETYCTVI